MSFDYKKAKFNFVEQRNKFFIFSLVLIVVGFGVLFAKGLNLGIDFTHGTKVRIHADHSISVDKLQS
ncbi:MAG TPA: protein translocase subunit SecF, partial [Bacillales bacterium]|nr:protein translocase subunit SecF [Bacillales bacterium]